MNNILLFIILYGMGVRDLIYFKIRPLAKVKTTSI